MKNMIDQYYGQLFEPALLEEIVASATISTVSEGTVLMEVGSYVKNMPLLLSGAIKILREDKEGNELLLYFLEKGDTCAMTMTCCIGQSVSKIKAVAEIETQLLLIPVHKMEEWLTYKSWRDFVFESYNSRMYEMLDAIDTLAFMNMSERLVKYLSNKSVIAKSKQLNISHQAVAYELNTSRVVISRLLKQLENDGKIKLHRNMLELLH
jgi:CRP/FNR family transcriptional regulator